MSKQKRGETQSSVRKLRHCNRNVIVKDKPDPHLMKRKVLKVTVFREVDVAPKGDDDPAKRIRLGFLILMIVLFALLSQDLGIKLPELISLFWSLIFETLLSASIQQF